MTESNSNFIYEKKINVLVELFAKNNIQLIFDEQCNRVLIDDYVIYYTSKLSAIQILEEVFVNMSYRFQTDRATPFIIDAGSEVGMATIFFKIFYPRAKILCFEAHPETYKILKKNIRLNKLSNIIAVNAALANVNGEIDFFGEVIDTEGDLDTRGSSIIEEWGLQRATSGRIRVRAVKLSEYIEEKVDYLKFNIRGAEQQVLADLDVTGKLKLVNKILLKFHQAAAINGVNSLESSLEILSRNQFSLVSKYLKNIGLIFPAASKKWAKVNNASLYTILLRAADFRHSEQRSNNSELHRRLSFLRISSLEEEVFLLKNVIDSVPSSIYWKDRDGFYLGHSGYAIQKLQATEIAPHISTESIVGMSDYDLFDQVTANTYRENDLHVMKNRQEFAIEEKVVTPKGEELVQVSSKKPLYDEKMEVVGIIGSTIDVTDCRRIEKLQQEKLQQDKELAERICSTMEVLAGAMAHEICNPLCFISLNVEQLEAIRVDPLGPVAAAINNIKLAVRKSSNIIDMLLIKLRSLVNPQVKDNSYRSCSIKHTIDEALNEYPFYGSERQKVSWDAAFYRDFMYQGNNLLIKHVIFNLIKNALRVIGEVEGGQIYISLVSGDNVNSLVFKDTALGIERKNMASLFLPFVSGSGSHGLGLAFCKLIMESHGGSIICKSVYGRYTEFVLSFPTVTRIPIPLS